MKKKFILILAVTSFLVGISIFLYPYIQQYLYKMHANEIISEFNEKYPQDDLEWLYLLMVKYNKDLYEDRQGNLVDPFSYSQVDFSLKKFGFDEEIVGYISVPKMNIDLPIYLGASEENMRKGAAHLTQTSLLIGRKNTNAVIAAHRGMSTAAMFRDIEKLAVGDDVMITNLFETIRYQVTEMRIIQPTDLDAILIQDGKDMVTLITCHPYRHNYQRYIVYAERVL